MTFDLRYFDVILLNTSGGKDSQVMLDVVREIADAQGVSRMRMVGVHCDLGRVEWGAGAGEWEGCPSARDLAEIQVRHYGVPRFETVRRELGDLLDQIERRGMFPGSKTRYCTSDQKTSQVKKLVTRLVDECQARSDWPLDERGKPRRVRILNCLGIRADESPARAKKAPLSTDPMNWTRVKGVNRQHGKRFVTRWYPIFDMSEDEVWERIAASGVPHHWAYDAGMPRLSCCFCVFAPKEALVRAAQLNPELAAEYARVEVKIGHRFTQKVSMTEVVAAAEESTQRVEIRGSWAA